MASFWRTGRRYTLAEMLVINELSGAQSLLRSVAKGARAREVGNQVQCTDLTDRSQHNLRRKKGKIR
jgi:hypothetical protein